MNRACWILASFCLLASGIWAEAQPTVNQKQIDALIRKLGSPTYVQRELARKELEAIGPAALETLRRASKSADVETRHRLAELIAKFERQILTRDLLKPKAITLYLKAVTPDEAVRALATASGYTINIDARLAKSADRKITLNAVKRPFWDVLDDVCAQAGLMEKVELATALDSANSVRLTAKRGVRLAVVDPPTTTSMAPIVLVERAGAQSVISYAGAVKAEVRVTRDQAAGELKLQFIVSSEPSFLNASIEGKPLIERAIDDRGRKLVESLPAPKHAEKKAADGPELLPFVDMVMMQRTLHRASEIKLKAGDDPGKLLKELSGKLTLQFDRHDQLLARIPKVLSAAGKSAAGANGGSMRLDSIRKLEGGEIEVQISMENLTQNPLGNVVAINGNAVIVRGFGRGWGGNLHAAGNPNELPALIDAKGQKCPAVNVTRETTSLINGTYARSVTAIYRLADPGAEPAELVLHGMRSYTIDVPFRFEKLRLP